MAFSLAQVRRLLCGCLLLLTFVPALGQEPPVPEWIKNLNPADYLLVNPDSTPAFPFHVDGSPTAEVSVRAYGVTLPDGTTQERREFLMYAQETIVGDNLFTTNVKGTTLRWRFTWDVTVMLFETPEIAAAVVKDRFNDTWGVDPLTDQALGDPRLRGQGVACATGQLVRYRNMIWQVMNQRIEEVKPEGGRDPIPRDIWNGGHGEAESHQYYKLTPLLAKRWLDKVAGPPVADLAIIGLEFTWEGLWPGITGVPFREPRADQQWVAARVQNFSRELASQVVMLQFYVQYQGEATPEPLGAPIKLADSLPPLGMASTAVMWDLKGKPVENATIRVECYTPDRPDPDPANNRREQKVSIWFAQDATGRPFTWGYDTYSFVNTGFKEQELEETVEGALALLLNNLQETPDARKLLQVAMFPPSYERLKKYFDTSMGAGAGGHCYGMAATAAVYFENPALKPVAKPVKDLTLAESSTNINLYHRAQVLTLLDALVAGWDWQQGRIQGTVGCGNAVKQQLAAGRLCTVVDFFSPQNAPPAGHSVLAYKYIEYAVGAPLVYVYDPNFPERALPVNAGMPQIRLWGNDFRCPPYMDYRTWAGGGRIGANRPFRTIPLETVNSVMPGLKKMVTDMVGWFKTAGKFMGFITCPADAVFTDGQGRRVGMVGGKPVNEIPGAEIRTSGQVEIYVLPSNLSYTLSVTGTGAGTMGVSFLRAEDATTAGVTSFQKLPLQQGTVFQGSVGPNGRVATLTAAGKEYTPTIAGAYDVTKLPTKGIGRPTAPTEPTGPDTGDLVVCRNVTEGGKPEGAADRFDQISKIYAHLTYKDLPAQTLARVSWKRDGQEFSQGERGIGGSGWVWFSVSTDRAGGYEPGNYGVTITAGGQVSRKSFTVGNVATSTPPPPTGEPELIFSITSIGVALNGATAPARFRLDTPRTITQVRTYHWNNGQGKTPGTIRLRDATGKTYGPWQAVGADGQGGVPNANWDVFPNVTLPPGEYNLIDSDPRTWAQNAETGGRGMCWVWAAK